MKIGNSIYVDIKYKGGSNYPFLEVSDLLDLQIVETAGASLPYIYIKMCTLNLELVQFINAKNVIQVCIGPSETEFDTFDVDIFMATPLNSDPSNMGASIEFSGFISNSKNSGKKGYKSEYMTCKQTKTYMGTALRVVNGIMQDFFGKRIETNFTIDELDEKVSTWRQCSMTPCQFVCDTLLHMNAMPDFPLFSFDKHGQFYVKSLSKLVKRGPQIYFTSNETSKTNEIRYYNNFQPESFKETYNIYSGLNKISEVYNSSKGISEYFIADNSPILATTQETTSPEVGNREVLNNIQNVNTHDKYVASYAYNTNKLVSLSSISGRLDLLGYYRDLAPLTLVQLSAPSNNKSKVDNNEGLYLIEAVKTYVDFASGCIKTSVFITRDEVNNIENYIVEKEKGLKISHKYKEDLLNAVSRVRSAYATGLNIIDGKYMRELLSYATSSKDALLRSFTTFGTKIDFNSSATLLNSIMGVGNNLLNSLYKMIFPTSVASVLQNSLLKTTTKKSLVSDYIRAYVPTEIRDIVNDIVMSLMDTNDTLNSIASDNGISYGSTFVVTSGETKVSDTSEKEAQVAQIFKTFENNTAGVRIPLPTVVLTEEEQQLPDDKLKELLADKTVENLEKSGYLTGIDSDTFKNILLGEEDLTFSIISIINANAGNNYSYKYWGTFTELIALTSFVIKKGFRDKYRTLPCTKLISATKNSRIFFSCPSFEKDVKFYVNSVRVDLPSFTVDLGFTDVNGREVLYTVYYTEEGYNSNSVLFEVKQGGLV